MTILPLNGYYQASISPILPSFYTEYYSQEDRLKAISQVIGRLIAWDDLAVEKINEIAETVNNSSQENIDYLIEQVSLMRTELVNLNNKVNTYDNAIADVKASTTNNTNSIENIEEDVDSLITQLEQVLRNIASINTEIESLKTKNTTQDTEIKDLKENNTAQDEAIENIKKDLLEQGIDISGIQSEVNNLGSRIEELENNSTGGGEGGGENPELEGRVEELENITVALQGEVDAIEGNIDGMETNILHNTNDIGELDTRVSGLEEAGGTDLTTIQADITTLYNDNFAQDLIIRGLEDAASDLTMRVETLETNSGGSSETDPELEGRVENLEIDIQSLNDHNTTQDDIISGIDVRVGDVEYEITGLDSRVEILENNSGGSGGTDPALEGRVEALENSVSILTYDSGNIKSNSLFGTGRGVRDYANMYIRRIGNQVNIFFINFIVYATDLTQFSISNNRLSTISSLPVEYRPIISQGSYGTLRLGNTTIGGGGSITYSSIASFFISSTGLISIGPFPDMTTEGLSSLYIEGSVSYTTTAAIPTPPEPSSFTIKNNEQFIVPVATTEEGETL